MAVFLKDLTEKEFGDFLKNTVAFKKLGLKEIFEEHAFLEGFFAEDVAQATSCCAEEALEDPESRFFDAPRLTFKMAERYLDNLGSLKFELFIQKKPSRSTYSPDVQLTFKNSGSTPIWKYMSRHCYGKFKDRSFVEVDDLVDSLEVPQPSIQRFVNGFHIANGVRIGENRKNGRKLNREVGMVLDQNLHRSSVKARF
jgi:hypothetical protein